MATTLQAIPTRYRGYNFRSRMEARWAVAFQEMGLRWEYEPQGFLLPSGKSYLPDFKVTLPFDGVLWVEIKPAGIDTPEFIEFIQEMCMTDPCSRGCVLHDIPDPVFVKSNRSYYKNDEPECCIATVADDEFNLVGGWDSPYMFCVCSKCKAIGFEWSGMSDRIDCGCDAPDTCDDSKVLAAFAAARGARFEHEHREVWR